MKSRPHGKDKPLVWLEGKVKSPPFSASARLEAGYLLRELQRGSRLFMPHSRTLAGVAPRCHELRIVDQGLTWRIVYRIDPDAIVIAEIFAKKSEQTPAKIVEAVRRRLRGYDNA